MRLLAPLCCAVLLTVASASLLLAPVTSGTGAVARATYEAFYVQPAQRFPSELVSNPGTPWGEFAGSLSCQPCHEEEYRRWRGSYHSRTLYDAVPGTVIGDFSGDAVFVDRAIPLHVRPFSEVDDRGRTHYYMTLRSRTDADLVGVESTITSMVASGAALDDGRVDEDWQPLDTYRAGVPTPVFGTYEVQYAFGNRRHQPFVARWPDGSHWVMPVIWDGVASRWAWTGFRPYVQSCASCHVTGIRSSSVPTAPRQKALPRTMPPRYALPADREGWADGAVGCEACHGGGRRHIDTVEELGVESYRELLAAGFEEPSIYDGKRATMERRMNQCDQCHNFHTESITTWFPGPHGFDRGPMIDLLKPNVHNTGFQFYADGTPMSPCTIGQQFRRTRMYAKNISCFDCHDPHGSESFASLHMPVAGNTLCLSCHVDTFPEPEDRTAHSHHAAFSPGNLCVECHMPRLQRFTNGIQVMSDQLHAHSFSIPNGDERIDGGAPSACNICHVDRDHAWTRQILAGWSATASARARP